MKSTLGLSSSAADPGTYLDSVDYVVNELESYGYDPEITEFNLPEWVENSAPTLARTDLGHEKT